jgi:hypothetical protein
VPAVVLFLYTGCVPLWRHRKPVAVQEYFKTRHAIGRLRVGYLPAAVAYGSKTGA